MPIRDAIRRVMASQEAFTADEERHNAAAIAGCAAVGDLTNRTHAKVTGVLRSVVLRPREGVPTVEAELYDGSGALDLIWLGRRRIVGIEPGRRALFEGFVCEIAGRRVMFNPKYELLARPTDEAGF